MTPGAVLVVLARWPRCGEVKTRLAAALGPAGALRLHRAMIADARDRLRRLARSGWRGRLVWADATEVSPGLRARLERRRDEGLQRGADLGARMAAALAEGLAAGAPACVLIGTDSPTLPDARLGEALAALRRADVVFGPAEDGGYYLVGARRPLPEIFAGVSWGGPDVLVRSLALAAGAGASTALLPRHYDVDRQADLERLRRELRAGGPAAAIARHTRRALREVARGPLAEPEASP